MNHLASKVKATSLVITIVILLPTGLSAQGTSVLPVIQSSVGDTTLWAGTHLEISLSAVDASGNALSVSAQSIPAAAIFSEVGGSFEWTPDSPQVQELLFSAIDAQGRRATLSIVVCARGELFPGTFGEALFDSLRVNYSPTATLGYDVAHDSLYATVDLEDDGFVRGIYTGFAVSLIEGDPSTVMYSGGISAEHVWPQSMGAGEEPQKSDLHNLYPAKSNVISSRSNKPFGEIIDAETDNWYRLDEVLTTVPEFDRDEYSESRVGRWEPRKSAKGDIARAFFYFAMMYPNDADESFIFNSDLYSLQYWTSLDPPSPAELRRSLAVEQLQGNINPFALDEGLSTRLYGIIEGNERQKDLPYTISVDIYPNPVSTTITIQISNQSLKFGSVILMDILGRTITNAITIQPFSGRSIKLDTSYLSSGIYFVVLNSDERIITRSFVVHR